MPSMHATQAIRERTRLLHRALRYRFKLDPDEIRHTLRLISPGACAIDLGAHKGGYTFWMARAVGASGRVMAVEAQPALAERLRTMFDRSPRVEVLWAAAADRDGDVELSVRGDGSSHGASIGGFSDEPDAPTRAVPCVTLATLAARAGQRIDFVKCDVEGAEIDVFAAAGELLGRDRPAVLVECETRHGGGSSEGDSGDRVRELARVFTGLGYEGRCVFGRQLVPIDDFDASIHQVYGRKPYGNNFLFVHPSRPSIGG